MIQTEEESVLRLLSLHQAGLLLLHWSKKLDDPFSSDALSKVTEDEKLYKDFSSFQWVLKNAIEADELPALEKPMAKPLEKKILDAAEVPDKIRKHLPKQYNYWITFTDLIAFFERPDCISRNAYAHSRDAIARVAWMLASKIGKQEDSDELFSYLEQIAEELSEQGVQTKLGETTLRGCVREILAAGEGLNPPEN
jgi:hypothetical protein